MHEEQAEVSVYRDSEPAFYEHLESMLEAGVTELIEEDRIYHVSRRRSEDGIAYFVLEPM